MSVIFIDTDSELPFDKAQELNLKDNFVIKMPYTICDEEKFCELNYNAKEFFTLVRNGNIPITSGLNAEIYKEYFEPYFKENEDILYVSFSQEMSGTFKYHDLAIKELTAKYPKAKYRRFDTKGISMATGIACYYAVKMHNEGKTNDEIVEFLTDFCPKINAIFSPNDLFYLKKGGRLSAGAAIFGTALQIKPIIKLNDEGKLYTYTKATGRIKSINVICEEVCANVKELDKYPIIVLNADCPQDADKVISKLKSKLPEATIWNYDVGPVIGAHCGPDTIACIYIGENRN